MKKAIALSFILLVSICLLVACGDTPVQEEGTATQQPTAAPTFTPAPTATASPSPSPTAVPSPTQTQSQPEGVPEGGEAVGFVYSDPQHDMTILILQPKWWYAKDQESGVVYFMNTDDVQTNNLISMTSFPIEKDPAVQMQEYWEFTKERYPQEHRTEIQEEKISAAGQYEGMRYAFGIEADGGLLNFQYALFATEDRIYSVIMTAEEEKNEEVTSALNDLLEHFQILSAAGASPVGVQA